MKIFICRTNKHMDHETNMKSNFQLLLFPSSFIFHNKLFIPHLILSLYNIFFKMHNFLVLLFDCSNCVYIRKTFSRVSPKVPFFIKLKQIRRVWLFSVELFPDTQCAALNLNASNFRIPRRTNYRCIGIYLYTRCTIIFKLFSVKLKVLFGNTFEISLCLHGLCQLLKS